MLGVFATNFRASKGVLTKPVAEAFTSPVIDLSNLVPSVFSRFHSFFYTSEACPHLCFFHALRPLRTREKNGDNYCSKTP
mmetsp:Transcript_13042/g.50987  ORF Transcript_13042/g.50987 Transcript_13042/m.50987 type:complete len:80 (+) Transcript_13042:286-525(+)